MPDLNPFRETFVSEDPNLNVTDVIVEQNASFDLTIVLTEGDGITPVNLSGWGVTGSVRQTYGGPVVTNFQTNITGVNTGTIVASLTGEQTWEMSGSLYFYDVIGNDPFLQTHRLVGGKIQISRGVTEP